MNARWLVVLAACAPLPAFAERSADPPRPAPSVAPAPSCSGEYADDLTVLAPRVRELERDPQNKFSYCLRTTATYECLSYAPDGSIRRARKQAVAHGTAFAYKRAGGETFLLTNEHVAQWPSVTDDRHTVEDVPAGCKMIGESIKVVDGEEDGYEANDVALTRVVADPSLDVAVLKTRAPLKVIPYKIGRSAAMHVGNAVTVHGFPLGAFAAMNLGKVVNAYDHDTAKDWDHVDFVIDALLSPGNSGSPVLAVSCKTGEYELVGVYHAGYVDGSALNVVVGIDQVRDLMTTLKVKPRLVDAGAESLGPSERAEVRAALAGGPDARGAPPSPFFYPLGPLVATARAAQGALWFELYGRAFPLRDDRLLVVEDLQREGGFGQIGRVFVGNRRGLRQLDPAALDADSRLQLERIVQRMRADALSMVRYRSLDAASPQGSKKRAAIERERDRRAPLDRDAAQLAADLADRLGPKAGEPTTPYREATAAPPPVAAPPPPVAVQR